MKPTKYKYKYYINTNLLITIGNNFNEINLIR